MWDQSYPYFLWIEKTGLGHAIRQSKWTFAIAEVLHLLGLTLLLGTVLIMALRIFGFVLRTKAVAEIARELRPWSLGGLTLVVLTGLLLFVSEATKCWGNIAFRYKMLFLFLALLFQFTACKGSAEPTNTAFPRWRGKSPLWFLSCYGLVWYGRTRDRVFLIQGI